MKLTGYLGGSSKQIDHGKYFNGGLELFMVHYTQCTWATNYINACRTHMTVGQENLWKKKRCSDNLVFILADTHKQSAFDNTIFWKPLLLFCSERWKRSFVKDQSKFQNPFSLFSDTCICLYEVCKFFGRSLMLFERSFWKCFLSCGFEVTSQKIHPYKALGHGKKAPCFLGRANGYR